MNKEARKALKQYTLGTLSIVGSISAMVMLFAFAYVHDTSGNHAAMLALIGGIVTSVFVAAMSLIVGMASE